MIDLNWRPWVLTTIAKIRSNSFIKDWPLMFIKRRLYLIGPAYLVNLKAGNDNKKQ